MARLLRSLTKRVTRQKLKGLALLPAKRMEKLGWILAAGLSHLIALHSPRLKKSLTQKRKLETN